MDKAMIEQVKSSVLRDVEEADRQHSFIPRELTELYLLVLIVERLEALSQSASTK